MCYQVVERYTDCRCLYYKHAIDPCAAHGQRGHLIQEKTVLVGYTCSRHSGGGYIGPGGYQPGLENQDIVDGDDDNDNDDANSSDESESGDSVWSSAITVSRATSFIAVGDHDPVEEVLKVFLDDPLLRWEKLPPAEQSDMFTIGDKDVRFFLRAFEGELRATADSNIEYHTCAWLRHRIGYFAERISTQFHLRLPSYDSYTSPDDMDEDTVPDKNMIRDLQPVTLDEADPTFTPHFENMRKFIFDGLPYGGLKANLNNIADFRRNHLTEIIDVVLQNIHPPAFCRISGNRIDKQREAIYDNLEIFLHDLVHQSELDRISAFDRRGLWKVQDEALEQLSNCIYSYWTDGRPPWHSYPLVYGRTCNDCTQSTRIDGSEGYLGHDTFANFVSTSSALLSLSWRLYTNQPSFPDFVSLSGLGTLNRVPVISRKEETESPTVSVTFECLCGAKIMDRYSMQARQRPIPLVGRLNVLSLQQIYMHAASDASNTSTFGGRVLGYFRSLTTGRGSQAASLPQHTKSKGQKSKEDMESRCSTQTLSNQHDHNYVHWCIPSTRYATHMHPLQSCRMYSDIDFFRALKDRYDESRRNLKGFFSFKKPIALRFVKFRLYHRKLIDIHETESIPPESRSNEYEYSPMPAESVPPIGSNLLMHFFMHPDHAVSHPVLFPCIPRRKKDGLEPCPVKGSSVGWGIDVITGTNDFKLFGLAFLGMLASLVFGAAWAVRMGDIQGGFAVAGFMFTLIAFGVASLKALDI